MMDDALPVFRRTVSGLIPLNDAAAASLHGIPVNSEIVAKVVRPPKPRNLSHHNRYWALIDKVARALGRTREEVHFVVKLESGLSVPVKTADGQTYRMPGSIAWSKMDQQVFNSFYERALVVICEHWLPGMEPSQLRDEIEELAAA